MADVEPTPVLHGFLLDKVAGIKPVYIPLRNGLTVLYGLNGAGKTRILSAIQGFWEGRRTGISAVVHIPLPQEASNPHGLDSSDHDPIYVSLLEEQMGDSLIPRTGRAPHVPDEPAPLLHEEIEGAYQQLLYDFVHREEANTDPYLGQLPENRRREVAAELQRQRLVLITPKGSRDRPDWHWQPLALADPRYPQITSELKRHESGELREDEPPFADSWQDADAQLMDAAIFERRPFLSSNGQARQAGILGWLPPLVLNTNLAHFPFWTVDTGTVPLLIECGRRRLRGQLGQIAAPGAKSDLSSIQDAHTQDLDTYSTTLNRYFRQALLDAPGLTILLRPEAAWLSQDPLAIRTTAGHDLADLSSAERKWADWAIAQTAQDHAYPGSATTTLIELLDEPEAALHRAAEAHMARAISTHAARPNRHVVVATHSPELLNQPHASLLHVRKGPGQSSEVVALTTPDRRNLEELGLLPSDLLRRQKAFLLVEGEHDELVLQTLIGSELAQMRVQILPIRGASKLPTALGSRLLYDFTDAQIIALVDNVPGSDILEAWHDAISAAKIGGAPAAGDELRSTIGTSSAEREWLAQSLSRALELGQEARVTPYGLAEPDVLDYLPVGCFVPQAASWRELRSQHQNEIAENTRGLPKDFKKWLTHTFHTTFDHDTIQVAAATVTEVPADISRLLSEIAVCTDQNL